MAGPYYVDISAPGTWNARTGTGAGSWEQKSTPLLGLSGLQYAFDIVAVGNGPVYIKGSESDGSKMQGTGSTTSNSGAFVRGEAVTWAGGGAGVVSEIDGSNYPTVIEVIGAVALPDSTEVTGAGGGKSTTGTVAQKSSIIDVDVQTGSNAGGFIKFIGCNDDADFTVNGNRAYIDVKNAVAHGISMAASCDMIWFENIEVDEAGTAKSGWLAASTQAGCVFINCCAHDNDYAGFTGTFQGCLFLRCVAYSNGTHGFVITAGYDVYLFCCSRDNTQDGFNVPTTVNYAFVGCISYHNTVDGMDGCHAATLVMNCVFDSNDAYAINAGAGTATYSAFLIANRITDTLTGHTTAGVDCNGDPHVLAWNYFDEAIGSTQPADCVIDDAQAELVLVDAVTGGLAGGGTTDSNQYNQNDDNQGYVDDDATPDFSTQYVSATDPVLRRVAVTVPWS